MDLVHEIYHEDNEVLEEELIVWIMLKMVHFADKETLQYYEDKKSKNMLKKKMKKTRILKENENLKETLNV